MKKFEPIWKCTFFEEHIKNELITVKLTYGYAILKKIKGFWLLGMITYKPNKNDSPIPVNLFMNIPKYVNGNFEIGKKGIPITSLSFKQRILYFSALPFGLIKKSYIKQMSA